MKVIISYQKWRREKGWHIWWKWSSASIKYAALSIPIFCCINTVNSFEFQGVIKREFLLSTQPVEGDWKISVTAAEVINGKLFTQWGHICQLLTFEHYLILWCLSVLIIGSESWTNHWSEALRFVSRAMLVVVVKCSAARLGTCGKRHAVELLRF